MPPKPPRLRANWRRIVVLVATTLAGAWCVGRIASDRYWWSQFLLWIPTIVPCTAVAIAATCTAVARTRRSRVSATLLVLVAFALALWLLLVDHRLPAALAPRGAGDESEFTALHCNLHWPGKSAAPQVMSFIQGRREDLMIFSEPGWLLLDGRGAALEAAGWIVARGPKFAVVSRLPIIEFRSLVWADSVAVTLLTLDGASLGIGVLTCALVDLPSSLSIGRLDLARRTRALLDSASPPAFDLAVGDFNITRNSAAMRELFPDLNDAFDAAGRGWGESFPAWLPLWSIDHVLYGPRVNPIAYELIRVPATNHLAQHFRASVR